MRYQLSSLREGQFTCTACKRKLISMRFHVTFEVIGGDKPIITYSTFIWFLYTMNSFVLLLLNDYIDYIHMASIFHVASCESTGFLYLQSFYHIYYIHKVCFRYECESVPPSDCNY